MGSGTWLQLLLTLGALWGIGARETQLGILGEPTLLQIPRKFQECTEEFGEATWKKTMEGSQKKTILLKISGGNVTEYKRERMRFHRGNFSLEILNTSRDDERLYEYSISKGPEEELWQIQLQVFEPVADPNIQILHRELSNGSCSLSLLCTSERGDEVSYSWDSWDNRTRGICSGNGRVLNVSYSLWNDSIRCVCTARNRVSSRDVAFDSSQCGSEQRGVPGVRTELLVPLVALGVIVIIIVAIVTVRATHSAKCCQVPSQVTPIGATSATIYAQVQKPKGTVPNAAPVSCTTIYAAATGPPLATDGAPRSPAASPTPRGHPQDTTTVYASVTLPVA
ncbi:signaling lymphocytic activation molecule isoform X2 [Oenanthe melanoleuca]|uniref:signaling lymphocytic activation molecule isoform X2 n=1 Tax=Oenanthe melanoleuca TaxID=2939378 RepID=UPI0024C1A77C|nr:signaling lymphocytic activation molecule isoform X2 [Oenanthe melanoleuca]